MSQSLTRWKRRISLRPVFGGSLALVWLVLALLAAGGPLHQALHHDGGNSANHCAACLLAKGLVDVTDTAVAVEYSHLPAHLEIALPKSSLPEESLHLLPPGRAPPVCSFAS